MMRYAVFFIFFLVGLTSCGEKTKDDYQAEIQEKNKELEEALNRKDREALGQLWAEDGILVNVTTNRSLKGREAILNAFDTLFEKNATYKVKIDSVDVQDDDLATETGRLEIEYPNHTEEEKAFKAIYSNQEGTWILQKLIEAEFLLQSTHYEHLKPLDWLIGAWVDDSASIDISYNNLWGFNRNFIVQDFKMQILGEEELAGQQIIGWDPAQKTIRSWIFDSDGGIGTGKWSLDRNTWYVQIHFTLSDGRVASALHLYKKIDEDTYTFYSENRDIDGKILPDIGPFKIVRKR